MNHVTRFTMRHWSFAGDVAGAKSLRCYLDNSLPYRTLQDVICINS